MITLTPAASAPSWASVCVVGRAAVDDQRLVRLAGERDLRRERPLLVGCRRSLAVEVKARLADRHAAIVRGERPQLCQVGVVEAGRGVGVASDRREDLREVLGLRQCGAAGGAVDADRQHPRDARRLRRRDELGIGRLAEVKVRVGIDHPASGRSFGNSDSSAGPALTAARSRTPPPS